MKDMIDKNDKNDKNEEARSSLCNTLELLDKAHWCHKSTDEFGDVYFIYYNDEFGRLLKTKIVIANMSQFNVAIIVYDLNDLNDYSFEELLYQFMPAPVSCNFIVTEIRVELDKLVTKTNEVCGIKE